MEKVAHKSASHRDALLWDIQQQIAMTPTERQSAAAELKRRVWGAEIIPIRSLPREIAAKKLFRLPRNKDNNPSSSALSEKRGTPNEERLLTKN